MASKMCGNSQSFSRSVERVTHEGFRGHKPSPPFRQESNETLRDHTLTKPELVQNAGARGTNCLIPS